MNDNALRVFTLKQKWAVIGVTDDISKYGYKIYDKLKQNHKTTYGINPKYHNIENNKIYSSVESVDDDIEVVVFVVNPNIGIKYLDSVISKNIENIWLQPGTVSDELLLKAKQNHINVIEACVLLVSNYENEAKNKK